MNENRADSFLRLIRRAQRGRLKIYLGYAAGVGKTYQMLLEAHRLQEDGIDVAVGLVETHGRAETAALLTGLASITRRKITHRGIVIEEMDLGAILARRPNVVLVDELAHTNVPGSKNAKRYQDVEELLAAGLHVISTLNIQHLESLYETIERATGVKVRERIPDPVVLAADQLVNVDITTEDLRRRLKEGKVYSTERIETALNHFFKSANLEQLRELALRELAAQIDTRRRAPLAEEIPSSPDQVMVALSSRGPNSEALLRYASRLAGRLNRNWYAVYVQTSRESPMVIDATTQRILANTLTLARQLGATIFTYKGDDIVKTLLQFAKEYRVGHIVIGTPGRKVPFWRRLKGEVSIAERLVIEGTGITVVVLDTKAIPEAQQGTGGSSQADNAYRRVHLTNRKGELKLDGALPYAGGFIWDAAIEKEKAIRQLLDICFRNSSMLKESSWQAVLERENRGGTFLGEDVTIPHARVAGLHRPVVALGIGRAGIQDPDGGRSFKIMCLLLSPIEPPETHLAVLGMISRIARDDQWRKEVLSARKSSDIMKTMRPWKERRREAG
jgi:two-component system, OmpR family, sensor histidine kinase KdpD